MLRKVNVRRGGVAVWCFDLGADVNYATIGYAFFMLNTGDISIYENGSYKGSYGQYANGDLLSVERSGSTVEYKKNGTTIYTSTTASSGDLMVDTSTYEQGGIISDAMIIGVP